MKKVLLLGTLFLATLLATSCVSDDVIGGRETPDAENGFFLQLSVQEPGTTGTGTRVATIPALPGESSVYSLHLLFFEASASGMFIDYIDLSPQNEYDINNDILVEAEPLNMTTPIRIDFTNEAYLSANEDYRILVIANIHTFVGDMEEWLETFDGMTFNQAQARMLSLEEYASSMYIAADEMVMTSTIVRRAGQPMIHTNLLRLFVRFDVVMSVRTQDDGYTLEWVEVWNVPTSTALWNSDFSTFGTHTRRFTSSGQLDPTVLQHRGVVYAFENRVANSTLNDEYTTCLILAISDNTGRTTFHRANVNANEGQILRRNHVYEIVVNRVTGLGANTAQDAWSAAVTTLDVNVRLWQDGGEGGLMFDGEDILAIGQNRIDFPGEGCDGDGYDVTIFTFSPNPNNVLRIVGGVANPIAFPDYDYMIDGNDPNNDFTPGFKALLKGRTLTVFAESTSVARYGFIELSFGTMIGLVTVVQSDQHTRWLYLSVGTTELDTFDQAGLFTTDNIYVSSSGDWQAELFLSDERFTFIHHSQNELTYAGSDGDFFRIGARGANVIARGHYAFVLVSLVDDPTINRVLVLRQNGTSDITLVNPNHANLVFRPIGTTIGSGYSSGVPTTPNYFRVGINPFGAVWEHSVSGYAANFFEVRRDGNDLLVLRKEEDLTTGDINVALPNRTMLDKTALITVFVADDPGTQRQINVRQQSHNISLSAPTTTAQAIGGTIPVTVTASCDSWQAAFPTNEWVLIPSIGPTGHEVRVMRGSTSQTQNILTVRFDAISPTLFNASASATLSVCLGAPFGDICASITFEQGERQLRNLYILSARPYWATWHPTAGRANHRRNLGRLRQEIASPQNFGVGGATVPSGARTFSTRRTSGNPAAGLIPTDVPVEVHIYLANSTNMSAARGAQVRAWLAADPRRVLIVTAEPPPTSIRTTGITNLLGPEWLGRAHSGSISNANSANGRRHIVPRDARNAALHDFMFEGTGHSGAGPFAFANRNIADEVDVRSFDAWSATLRNYPSSFITLATWRGEPGFGICPVNRIVFLGEPEIFGIGNRTRTNWSNPANLQFVQNVAAWIIMTTQHGASFTEQFH